MSARPAGMARLEATVRGRVHGVGYRYFAISRAMRLGLTGWVSNEQDGSVRVVAEGPRADLDDLLTELREGPPAALDELREGPPAALVEYVTDDWLPYTGRWSDFGIRSGGHRGD
jgi:acylphosphatase